MGFKEPNIGFGRTFPIWENPLKSQMIPTNFPLLTQFGNFEKFPVIITFVRREIAFFLQGINHFFKGCP